jgi:hypothetical protein
MSRGHSADGWSNIQPAPPLEGTVIEVPLEVHRPEQAKAGIFAEKT